MDFASVHDCFWTQAGDVSRMNSILRDQFVKLYTDTDTHLDIGKEISTSTNSTVTAPIAAVATTVKNTARLFPVLERLRCEMVAKYGKNLVPVRGASRHIQRQRQLKHPDRFVERDWRPLCIPALPLDALLPGSSTCSDTSSGDAAAELFDVKQVLNSTYFFH